MRSTPWLSRNSPINAWMYRPTPVASPSPSARVSIATRRCPTSFSLPLWGTVGWGRSGVGIDPRLLREDLEHPPGGKPVEVVGPQGHDTIAHRRDGRPLWGGEHEGAGRRRHVEGIAIVSDDPHAELAESRDLVDRHIGELEREAWLGDAGSRLPDRLLVAGAAQDDDAFGHRLVGHHGKPFRRPGWHSPLR